MTPPALPVVQAVRASQTPTTAAATTAEDEQQLVGVAARGEQNPSASAALDVAALRGRVPSPPGAAAQRRAQQLLPTVVYDPAAAEDYFKKHPLLLARRVAKVGAYLMQFASALVAAQVDAAVLGVRPEPGVSWLLPRAKMPRQWMLLC